MLAKSKLGFANMKRLLHLQILQKPIQKGSMLKLHSPFSVLMPSSWSCCMQGAPHVQAKGDKICLTEVGC